MMTSAQTWPEVGRCCFIAEVAAHIRFVPVHASVLHGVAQQSHVLLGVCQPA